LQSDSANLSRAADDSVATSNQVIQFEQLYQSYLTKVFNYVRYRVLNTTIAEDVTADIFTSAFQSLNAYRSDRGAISTWLFAIARRRVADYFRKSRRSVDSVPLDMAVGGHADIDVEKLGTQAADVSQLVHMMPHLGDRECEVIALRIGVNLGSKEVGRQLGLTAGNVDVILFRSLKKLRALLVKGDDNRG